MISIEYLPAPFNKHIGNNAPKELLEVDYGPNTV